MADKQNKRRHHVVPRLYLRGFCDQDGDLWVYQKDELSKPPYCCDPKATAFVNNFYAIHLERGEIDSNTYENALNDIIERPAINSLKDLRKGKTPDHEQRQRLSLYFGHLLVRTPSYRSHYEKQFERGFNTELNLRARHAPAFAEWAEEYKRFSNGKPLASNIEELRQQILDGKFKLSLHPNYSLYIMQKLGFLSSLALATMRWVIVKTTVIPFITSDNPIYITNPRAGGFFSPGLLIPDTTVFVPISKHIGLLMVRLASESTDCVLLSGDEVTVREMNKGMIYSGDRFIYAPEQYNSLLILIDAIA